MTRGMPAIMPIAVAVFITALLGGMQWYVMGNENIVLPVLGILGTILMLAPFLVPVLWAWALLRGQPQPWVLVGAASLLAAGLVLMPKEVTANLATYVALGLVAGFGLMLRWKPSLILFLLAVISTPVALWSLNEMPMGEVFEAQKEQVLESRRELLTAAARTGEEPPSLAQEEQMLNDLFDSVLRLAPAAVALGIVIQAAATFGFIWILVRVLGLAPFLRGFPSFVRWRFPFAVVWILAAAVALMIIPLPWWTAAGLNLVLVVTTMLAVQGAALQWHMSSASVPMLLRLFFLFMAGLLFLPLVVLGLADQWMDFRKLEIDDQHNDHDSGGNDDDSASDADNESS